MTTEDYLKQYAKFRSERLNREAELNAIVVEESLPGGIDYSKDRIQTTPGDAMFNIHLRIEKRTKELEKRILWLMDQMETIEEEVNAVKHPPSMTMLHMRYIENKRWKPIIKELRKRYPKECCYSDAYMRGKFKDNAIEEFEKEKQKCTKVYI